jgi:hypothetical protein
MKRVSFKKTVGLPTGPCHIFFQSTFCADLSAESVVISSSFLRVDCFFAQMLNRIMGSNFEWVLKSRWFWSIISLVSELTFGVQKSRALIEIVPISDKELSTRTLSDLTGLGCEESWKRRRVGRRDLH